MWHIHASGAADQSLANAMVRPEHSDAVSEEGRRDSEMISRGVLQPHMRRRGRAYRGGG